MPARNLLLAPLLGILAALFLACGGSGRDTADDPARAGDAAEWTWLRQAKQRLDAKREELARARAAARPGAPAPPALATLEKEVRELTDELNRRLVDFINGHPAVEGEPPAGRLLEAIRLKSDEDIRLAREHIERGGDYRRAIDIYEAALAVDPENSRLRQELERAQAWRYMTAERFAQVQEGMTQEQVRSLLGQPNLNNVRQYEDKGITAWFYTKDPQGRAAAVWFQRQAKGHVVYEADFDAVGTTGQGGAAGPDGPPEAPAPTPSAVPSPASPAPGT